MSEQLGLKRGTVRLANYQPEWEMLFNTEKRLLKRIIGKHVSDIEHIGSTSVPDLASKPIIDMIAAVNDLAVYKQLIEPFAALGYEFMPGRVFVDRVFFPKGPRENRTYHLNLVVKDSDQWQQTIAFRDYLRKNKIARIKYQAYKTELAAKYPNDRTSYTKAKEQFISQLLKDALL